MPAPSSTLTTLRPEFNQSLMEFDLMANQKGFIASQIFPVIEVGKPFGPYGRIKLSQLLQTKNTQRAPGTEYARDNWDFETDSFSTQEHGMEAVVDDRESEMYSSYFDSELVAAARARHAIALNYELRVAAKVFNATTFTSQTAAVTYEWNNASSGVPITDFETAAEAVWNQIGSWPNALVINKFNFRALRNNAQIIDRVKYVMKALPKDIGIAELQSAFDIPYIIVADAAQGPATDNVDPDAAVTPTVTWSSEYAMVCRVCETNDIREPGLGRTFHYGADGSTIGGTFESYRAENVRGNVIRCRMDTDEKIIYTAAGYLLSNIHT